VVRGHDVAVVAYSPFGSGRFPRLDTPGGRVLERSRPSSPRQPRQVALRFLTDEPSVFAIPKAAQSEHVEDNARAAALRLTEADIARLEQAFPLGRKPRELPTL
jgi:diketogulonate reductase-like aldo/keto reductase